MIRIESLLSARQFIAPQLVDDRAYFVSNQSGRMSLYAMAARGSVPEPLLPPYIALQNPELIDGLSFAVFPDLDRILVMLDKDGDEHYQPMFVPLRGGYPELALTGLEESNLSLLDVDRDQNIAYFIAASREAQLSQGIQADLATGEISVMMSTPLGGYAAGHNAAHDKVVMLEAAGMGDHVVYLWEKSSGRLRLLMGVPLADRAPGQEVTPNSFQQCHFVQGDTGLVFFTSLFSDTYGLGYLALDAPEEVEPIRIKGIRHEGVGEFEGISRLTGDRYALQYNIDGCTWLYEGVLDVASREVRLEAVIAGQAPLAGGVLKGHHFDEATDRWLLSFTTATMPTQLILVSDPTREQRAYLTRERVLGIPEEWLSSGEDASFTSFDGLRISARLYLPAESLGFQGPRPVVYYVHGGPTSQEHPDFSWFSMPLIQYLTLKGFAVFVPNVRGSTGYGHAYTDQVMRDWGGKDRLDHVHALTQVLSQDPRLDTSRAGVVGRSYGGYMTLTLASRHPELWSAAVDMFGPYNLFTFAERVPEAWKPFFVFAIGDPVEDAAFYEERSPRTHIHQLSCPLLVIQGKNDPRVREQESRELVEDLRAQGKEVTYLMFEDEGHDVLKFPNRVRCYNAIADFFAEKLQP
jgi:pimeloyl-ACP methyl ester carboxylesterase